MTLDFTNANADLQAQNSAQVSAATAAAQAAAQAALDAANADLQQAQDRPAAVTVASGDNFSKYAADYGMTVAKIQHLNPDLIPTSLPIGATVWLVEPGTVPNVDPPPDPPPPDPDPDPAPGQAFLFGHVALTGSE